MATTAPSEKTIEIAKLLTQMIDVSGAYLSAYRQAETAEQRERMAHVLREYGWRCVPPPAEQPKKADAPIGASQPAGWARKKGRS